MLLMIVALLAMLFMLVSAYIILARFDRQTLQMTSRANEVERILDGVSAVAAAAVRGPRGSDLVSGTSYVDIPGYGGDDPSGPWGSPWLASGEPVLYPGANPAYPANYQWPAVSGFSGPSDPNDPNALPMTRLLLDDPNDTSTTGYVDVQPGTSTPETLLNARQPFADADGDGMPDSRFGSVGLLTEMANALGGRSVRATGINTSGFVTDPMDPNYANYLAWQQYDSTARYAVAAKVVSHGGMVQVSAPTDVSQWNSEFIGGMFNWILHPLDGGGLYPALNLTDREQLQAMWAARGSVEPALRRRGGIIGGTGANTDVGEPFALRTLSNRFRWTFGGAYDSATEQYRWQRFNLASLDDWNAWRQAATIDPYWYNEWFESGGMSSADQRLTYAQRQLLTTVNHSDELARDQSANLPDTSALSTEDWFGTRAGEFKYYLGQITDTTLASNGVPLGAFWPDGSFNDAQALPGRATPRGQEIVGELASYFNEMLVGYGNWNTAGHESITRPVQAFMLAVNTVAFAAPRMTGVGGNEHIDAVYFDDTVITGNRYIGYAPQPFISHVIVYNNPDPGPPVDTEIALAVELYNPYDPAGGGNLDASRFAVSFNRTFNPDDTTTYYVLGPSGTRMDGRSFLVLVNNAGNQNQYFDLLVFNGVAPIVMGGINEVVYASAGAPLSVQLYRQGTSAALGWYLVDDFDIDTTDVSVLNPEDEWYINVKRDKTYEPSLGSWIGAAAPEARWRMTVSFDTSDTEYKTGWSAVKDTNPDFVVDQLASGGGPAPGGTLAPCVPLYTMNADAVQTFIHGAARPASFPTTGFMLFVPRFSHVVGASGGPITRMLYMQWAQRGDTLATYPADFGHMPIFDNKQEVRSSGAHSSDFVDAKTGRVPWGLLVFDYFTTLNPYDAIDPYRVPGRININTASWYVLAGLPLIGPMGAVETAELPIAYVDPAGGDFTPTNAAPAFWSSASGILAGKATDTIPPLAEPEVRYPIWLLDSSTGAHGQWYRLGPYLAQAAAGYRDRLPYVGSASALSEAPNRNTDTAYRPTTYDTIRATNGSTGALQRGFLTVGELANVMGFDGSAPARVLSGVDATVLGGYGYGVGGDFMKAVSLLALLDTHFLTTRSNTFTVYTTLYDRENPQASVRSQVTLDRGNLLPRLMETSWQDTNGNLLGDLPWVDAYTYSTLQSTGSPELIARRDYSYFNAQYDQ